MSEEHEADQTEIPQRRSMPICPMMGTQIVPMQPKVQKISGPRGQPELVDRMHPCVGPGCSWWVTTSKDGAGMCAVLLIALSGQQWQEQETE